MGKLSGFLELLKEPLKNVSRNGKFLAIAATVYLILYSICFILGTLSIHPFVLDLMLKLIALASSRPGTPEFTKLMVIISKDTGFLLGIEAAYIVLFYFIALFAQTAVIIIATCYYSGYNLSLKDLILKVSITWTRPFVTSILVLFLALGYTSFFILPFLIPSLVLFDHPIILKIVLIFLAILFYTLYIYLSVVWSLAVVVSIVENSYGFSALGKAKELVNGNRLHGFLLQLVFTLVMLAIVVIGYKLSPAMPIVVGVIETVLIGVYSMFQFMVYTGFYYQCKNDMTKSGGLEYNQIPTAHVDEYLP